MTNYSTEFKTKIVLEVIKGERTLTQKKAQKKSSYHNPVSGLR